MAKRVVNGRWSYADDRRLIQLAASSKSVNAIADEMNRPPEAVVQMALRLGTFLKSAAQRKADEMSPSNPALRPWTADEQEKLDDLLRAGKDAGEMATALQRTRQAIYKRVTTPGRKTDEVLATRRTRLKAKPKSGKSIPFRGALASPVFNSPTRENVVFYLGAGQSECPR
jgi:hypothetical protein